jgi:hypothetical protein
MGYQYTDYKDLLAYKKAYQQACEIFSITLSFPNSTLLKYLTTNEHKKTIEEHKIHNHPDSNRDHKRTQ